MSKEKGEVVKKEQCPQCREMGLDTVGDNLVTFDSGVQHCHRHGTVGKSKPNQEKFPIQNKELSGGMIEGEDPNQTIRGISPKTMKFYGYQISREKKCHLANYYDVTGKLVMQQMRTPDKKFPLLGDTTNNGSMLYGQWKFTPTKQCFITITEGQLDALSIAEVFNCKYPVVSIPRGAGSAKDCIAENLQYLQGFKYVVLCFDGDKPGREAVEECINLFEPGKVRIARLATKDANEMLQAGKADELRQAIYNAVEYIPPAILTGDAWLETLSSYKRRTRAWPWQAANESIAPISTPGIYTIAGLPGHGKTVFVKDIVTSTIESEGKVGIISLEESLQFSLLKVTDMIMGTNLCDVTNRGLTQEEIETCRAATKKVVTYNHQQYGSSLATILDNLPYISQSLDCSTIIFDNLSYAATDESEDERRAIDRAMIKLKDCSTKYDFTLINVTHLNDDGKDHKDSTIRGSRGVIMYSDFVLHMGRNVESESFMERNTLNCYVKKDRLRGIDTGKSFDLRYDPIKKRFIDDEFKIREKG